MFDRPTFKDVRKAFKPFSSITLPDGDNEGNPINGETLLLRFKPDDQAHVLHLEKTLYAFTRTADGQVNKRAVNTLTRNGFTASLGKSQYLEDWDSDHRLLGSVTYGEWKLDISDPSNEPTDDY